MKLNRHQQPILPNIFLLVISLISLSYLKMGNLHEWLLQLDVIWLCLRVRLNHDFNVTIRNKHPEWYINNNTVKGEMPYAL